MALIKLNAAKKTKTGPPVTWRVHQRGAVGELSEHYAALLRLVQSRQGSLNLTSYALGITSCLRGEGVTTVAANLAIAGARCGRRRVLLIDANTRYAALANLFDLETTTGLTDVLSGTALLGDCVQASSAVDYLNILPAGSPHKVLGPDFDVTDVSNLLDELKSEYDLIVFDLPYSHESGECYAYAQMLDGMFLVIEAAHVDVQIARRVTNQFARSDVCLLGAIYNQKV